MTDTLPDTDTTAPTRTSTASDPAVTPAKKPAKPHTAQKTQKTQPRESHTITRRALWFGPRTTDTTPRFGRTKFFALRFVIRGVVLAVDYLAVVLTAVVIVPTIGAWLHQRVASSGTGASGLSMDGTIALWVAPFAFVLAMLVGAEFVLLRGLWRAAGRFLAGKREQWVGSVSTGEASVPTVTSPSSRSKRDSRPSAKKTNRKGKGN